MYPMTTSSAEKSAAGQRAAGPRRHHTVPGRQLGRRRSDVRCCRAAPRRPDQRVGTVPRPAPPARTSSPWSGAARRRASTISGAGTAFSLHPQAAHRLDTLVDRVLGTAAASIRPIPHTVVVRGVTGTLTDTRHAAGDQIATAGTWSFHDDRGLIICPIAVAAAVRRAGRRSSRRWRRWRCPSDDGGVAAIARRPTGP